MRFKLTKITLAIATLAFPELAFADPGSLAVLALGALAKGGVAWAALTATQALLVSVGVNVIAAADRRRKARKEAARAKAAYNSSLEDRNATVLTALPPRRIVYGRVITGGDVVAIFSSDKTSMDTKGYSHTKPDAYKHLIVHFASHQCQAINEIYIDGVPLGTLDGSGAPTGGEFYHADRVVPRMVHANPTYTFDKPIAAVLSCYTQVPDSGGGDNYVTVDVAYTVAGATITCAQPANVMATLVGDGASVTVQKHLGSPTQTADAFLMATVPGQWTSSDRLRGLAYIVITLDLEDQRFQGGPPNITADISGKLVFDGRTDTTVYSNNPALLSRDYLVAQEGYGVDFNLDIDDAAANAAATACEVPITLTLKRTHLGLADLVETNQPKYTANGAFTSDDSPEAILEELAGAMAGDISYSAKWTMQAGTWVAPVMDLTDDDLHGMIDIVQCGAGLDDLFNAMRISYVPAQTAVPVDMDPPYKNDTFILDDGEELFATENLPFTDHPTRATNIARIKVEKARSSLVIRYPAKLKAWPLQTGDRVTVSSAEYGWTSKTFRVTDWTFSLTSAVVLTLQEDIPGIWDLAEAAEADPSPNTNLPNPNVVDHVTGLTATSGYDNRLFQTDGTSITRILVEWDPVTAAYVADGSGFVEIRWLDDIGVFQTQRARGNETSAYLSGFVHTQWVMIEATVVNGLGRRSNSIYIAHRVDGSTNPPFAEGGGWGNMVYGPANGPISYGPGVYGNTFVHLKNNASGYNPYGLKPGEPLTLSADVWQDAISAAAGQWAGLYLYAERLGGLWTANAIVNKWGTTPERGEATFDLPATDADMYLVGVGLFHQPSGGASVGTVYADRIMVNRGQVAGDYMPGTDPAATRNVTYVQTTPPAGSLFIGDIWLDSDADNRMYRWDGTQWVDITGRGKRYRILSKGLGDTNAPAAPGVYNAETNALIASYGHMYTVHVFDKATGGLESSTSFNTLDGGSVPAAMAGYLNSIGNAKIVAINTFDEPQGYRLVDGLAEAMYRCGASKGVFGSPNFQYRSAYVLVGVPGVGEGGGFEAYNGDTFNSTNAWCDVYFQIIGGHLLVTGMSSTPRTLQDYSYAGSMTATTTFVQASAPVATATGDLWYDSDGGYLMYRWNGSAWVPYQYDTEALDPSAVGTKATTSINAVINGPWGNPGPNGFVGQWYTPMNFTVSAAPGRKIDYSFTGAVSIQLHGTSVDTRAEVVVQILSRHMTSPFPTYSFAVVSSIGIGFASSEVADVGIAARGIRSDLPAGVHEIVVSTTLYLRDQGGTLATRLNQATLSGEVVVQELFV